MSQSTAPHPMSALGLAQARQAAARAALSAAHVADPRATAHQAALEELSRLEAELAADPAAFTKDAELAGLRMRVSRLAPAAAQSAEERAALEAAVRQADVEIRQYERALHAYQLNRAAAERDRADAIAAFDAQVEHWRRLEAELVADPDACHWLAERRAANVPQEGRTTQAIRELEAAQDAARARGDWEAHADAQRRLADMGVQGY